MKTSIKLLLACTIIGAAVIIPSSCSEKPVRSEKTDPVEQPDTTRKRPDPLKPDTIISSNDTRLVEMIDRKIWQTDDIRNYLMERVATVDISSTIASTLIDGFMASRLPAMNILFLTEGSRNWHIEQVTYSYRSLSASGDSITLKGTVIFPCSDSGNIHQLDGLTLYNHFVTLSEKASPTNFAMTICCRAYFNNAVICSDTEGYGTSSDRIIPFFNGLAKGRQEVDAAMAALEIINACKVTLKKNAYTENVGTSLGGPQALGAQKYLESDECPQWCKDNIPGLRTFATAGPYEPREIFMSYTENDSLVYSFIPILMIYTIFSSYPDLTGNYDIEDFFCPELVNMEIELEEGSFKILDAMNRKIVPNFNVLGKAIREKFGAHMLQFISQDMIDAEGKFNPDAPKSRIILEALDRCKVTDWTPKNPVMITHSKTDEVIPYDLTYAAYQKLAADAEKVYFADSYSDHSSSTNIGLARILLLKHPSYNIEWPVTKLDELAGMIDFGYEQD